MATTAKPTRQNITATTAKPPQYIGLLQHALGLLAMLTGGAITGSWLLDLAGLPVQPWTVGLMVFLLFAAFGANFWWQVRRGRFGWGKWQVLELVVGLGIAAGFLVYALWLGRPNLMPVGPSVDSVYQYGLADYIYQHAQLQVHATDTFNRLNLQDGVEYPPGFVVCAALVSQLLSLDPVYTLYPVVAFFMAGAVFAAYGVVVMALRGRPWRIALGGLAAALVLIPYGYVFGSFTYQSYMAQIAATCFLMLALYFILAWQRDSSPENAVLAGLTMITLVITYPPWAIIPPAAWALVTLTARWLPLSRRLIYLFSMALVLGGVALLFLKDRLSTGVGTFSNEGDVTLPNLALFGWPVVVLAGLGLLVVLVRGERAARTVMLFGGLVFGLGFALWVLKTYFDTGSYYAIYKLLYLGAFILPLMAVLGLDWLLARLPFVNKFSSSGDKRLPTAWAAFGIGAFALSLGLTWTLNPRPDASLNAINQDSFRVAQWMKQNLKIGEYSVGYDVPFGTPTYWLQVGIFKQPRTRHALDLLYSPALSFQNWFYNIESEQYLFTRDIRKVNLDERIQVLYQSGTAAVLTRTPAFKDQQSQRQNLIVSYKAELNKRTLSLNTDATVSQEVGSWVKVGLQIQAEDGTPVYQETSPAEINRIKKQFLGMVVRLPDLTTTELYSNNNYPKPLAQNGPLQPGSYRVWIQIFKNDRIVEQRELMRFSFGESNNFDAPRNVQTGQFYFEGGLPGNAAAVTPLNFKIGDETATLQAVKLAEQAERGSTTPVTFEWKLDKATLQNQKVTVAWQNEAGQLIGQTSFVPLNGLYPTWMWPGNAPAAFSQSVKLPDAPGRYKLAVGLGDDPPKPIDKTIEVR